MRTPSEDAPTIANTFCDPKRDHLAQAQLHLKCPISCHTALHLPCAVAIYRFPLFHLPHFTYSQRAWTKMTWLMLKQNSLKLLTSCRRGRVIGSLFFLFVASRKGLCVYRCVASRKGALLLLFSSLPLLSFFSSSLLLFFSSEPPESSP